jgi:hypothetical protein
MKWHVYVQGPVIEPAVRLDFSPQALEHENDPIPDLGPGDGLVLEFPTDDRVTGTLMSATSDEAVIEVGVVRWSIRCASPAENLIHAARGARTVSWIVGAKMP